MDAADVPDTYRQHMAQVLWLSMAIDQISFIHKTHMEQHLPHTMTNFSPFLSHITRSIECLIVSIRYVNKPNSLTVDIDMSIKLSQ